MGGGPGLSSSVPSLPPPCLRSPPVCPDLSGWRREIVKIQLLEREKSFLEGELKFIESLQPASTCCKEVVEFVNTKADPFIPMKKKVNKRCRLWKWICKSPCLVFSYICCCSGCSRSPKVPDCHCCSTLCNCGTCTSCPSCCSLPKLSCKGCLSCSCSCSCCCSQTPCPKCKILSCKCCCKLQCPCSCKFRCPNCSILSCCANMFSCSCPNCTDSNCCVNACSCSCPKCTNLNCCPNPCSCPTCKQVCCCFNCSKNCCNPVSCLCF